MPVKVMGRLPDPDRNSLADLAVRFNDDPHAEVCAVVTFRPMAAETAFDDDDEVTVKLRILDVELIEGAERGFVEAAARSAREARTGRRTLPGFGTVFDASIAQHVIDRFAADEAARSLGDLPDGVDPTTGEVAPVEGDDGWETPPRDDPRGGGHD